MHCKPEPTFISARFVHEKSIARTTDFPVDFFSLWCLGFGFLGFFVFFWFGWLYLCVWKVNNKFNHLIIKISLRRW